MSGNHDEIHVLSAMNVNISTSNNRWYALCESTPDKSEADLAISDDEVFENGNYMYVPFNFDNVNVNTTDLDHPGDSNYKVKRIFAGSGTAMLLSSTRDHDAFGLQIGIPLFRMGYPLGWPAVGDKVGEDWLPGAHLYWHTNTGSSYRMLEHEKYFTANDLLTGTVLRDGHTWYLYDLRAQMEADGITPKVEECGTANGVPQYCYPAQGIGVRVYDELGSSTARVAATARPASLARGGDDAENLLSQRPPAARPMAWSNSHWRPLTQQEIGESDSPWAELYRQANGIPALPQAH